MVFMSAVAQGISLRQAALVAGFGLLIMTIAAPFAEFIVYARLVVPGNTDATVQNMQANDGLLLAGIFSYLLVFICDVLVAWARYIPKFLGVLLLIAGSAWVIYELGPYFYPGINLGYLMIAFSMELVFMAWLLIRGWRIRI